MRRHHGDLDGLLLMTQKRASAREHSVQTRLRRPYLELQGDIRSVRDVDATSHRLIRSKGEADFTRRDLQQLRHFNETRARTEPP